MLLIAAGVCTLDRVTSFDIHGCSNNWLIENNVAPNYLNGLKSEIEKIRWKKHFHPYDLILILSLKFIIILI